MSHADFQAELESLRARLPEVVEETTPSKSLPVQYSIDLAQRVVSHYEQGESLSAISKRPGMPAYSTLLRWAKEHPELSRMLLAARTARALHFEDAAIQAAEQAQGKDADRLKFEAYKWGAEVNDPATYGKRTNVQADVKGQVVLQVVTGFGDPNPWQTPPKLKADGTIDKTPIEVKSEVVSVNGSDHPESGGEAQGTQAGNSPGSAPGSPRHADASGGNSPGGIDGV